MPRTEPTASPSACGRARPVSEVRIPRRTFLASLILTDDCDSFPQPRRPGPAAGILGGMEKLHPYPQIIPLETRWRLAREEMAYRSSRQAVDSSRRRFGRIRGLIGH